MKLVIDIGNTLTKIAVFDAGQLIDISIQKRITKNLLIEYIDKTNTNFSDLSPIKSVIISSVVEYPQILKRFINKNYKFIELDEHTKVPIINRYKSPTTLGKDRLAAVVAANYFYKNQDLLVIDAGTCITYDLINSKGEYIGGSISPGISIRFQALHNFTGKLPLLEKTNFEKLTGQNTKESILSGVMNGILFEVEGVINHYKQQYTTIKTIISGGDIKYFDKRLKNNIFAFPNLVLFGLNIILEHNDN
ncbi:MAG: type III pantothenate kinase [Bacteroidales bacterium]|nr:type III pantothenate kinase [Bacteroidales bacterium]